MIAVIAKLLIIAAAYRGAGVMAGIKLASHTDLFTPDVAKKMYKTSPMPLILIALLAVLMFFGPTGDEGSGINFSITLDR